MNDMKVVRYDPSPLVIGRMIKSSNGDFATHADHGLSEQQNHDVTIAAMLRQAADDCERLDALDKLCEAYGFEDLHEGNRWCIEGPFANVRDAIDTARTPKKQTK